MVMHDHCNMGCATVAKYTNLHVCAPGDAAGIMQLARSIVTQLHANVVY